MTNFATETLHTVRRFGSKLVAKEAERRYGRDVLNFVYLDDLGLEAEGRNYYAPSNFVSLRRSFRRLRLGPSDVIVDIGAGKGLAVLVAAQQPVSRVVGVELAEPLCESARRNIVRRGKPFKAKQVEIINVDALEWEIPDEVTVVFIYNSFTGEVFQQFMKRLFDSVDKHPRPLRLIYRFPWEHNWLCSTGRVRTLDVTGGPAFPRRGWWQGSFVSITYGIGPGPFPPVRGLPTNRKALARWSGQNDATFFLDHPRRPTSSPH